MTKRIFSFLATCACCLALCVSLTSCPDPDPEPDGPGPAPTPATSVSDFGGTHLVAFGLYTFSYDSDGRVVSVKYQSEEQLSIDYANGLIYCYDDGLLVSMGTISFNSKGYITQIKISWDDIDGGWQDCGTYTLTLAYNNEGNLIKFDRKINGTENDLLTGKEEEYSENDVYTFTWANGNLSRVTNKYENVEDGEKEVESSTYDFTYGDTNNPFRQYLYSIVGYLDINDHNFVLGLYGKGPVKYPISMKHVHSDGTSIGITFLYTLLDNGTISTETFDGDKYLYSYRSIGDSRAYVADGEQQPLKARDRIGKHGRHRRHHKKNTRLKQ